MVMRRGNDTTPSSAVSSPAMILKSVVLPEPFGPTSPTFSPGLSWKDASTKSSCLPYCLVRPWMAIIELTIVDHGRPTGGRSAGGGRHGRADKSYPVGVLPGPD